MLTREQINYFFEYRDGNLYWKNKTSSQTRVQIGSLAGSIDTHGHRQIVCLRRTYLAHRLIFLMYYGFLPVTIDHKNGIRDDNRIENLRAATMSQNNHNSKLNKRNTSGVKGVSWNKKLKKWAVYLGLNGSKKHLGLYDNLELADLVAQEARNLYHKEFARHK